MQNTDSSHDDGGTESCDASEGEGNHGQTGTGYNSGGQSMSPQSPEMTSSGQAGNGMAGGEPGRGESGSQNAYDIPRYTSEGNVLGRPQEENNPQSAGNVQAGGQIPQPGSFQGAVPGAYQQAPPQMQPQSMYNQAPPQQMQPQNVYQQNPAQPVYQQNPYNTQYVPPYVNQPYLNQQPPQPPQPPPPEEQSDAGAKRHGQIMDVVNGIINGESPDVPKIIDLFESMDTRFWKGAMIGAGVVLLATNGTVKKAIGDVLSGIMGKSGKPETEKGEK